MVPTLSPRESTQKLRPVRKLSKIVRVEAAGQGGGEACNWLASSGLAAALTKILALCHGLKI